MCDPLQTYYGQELVESTALLVCFGGAYKPLYRFWSRHRMLDFFAGDDENTAAMMEQRAFVHVQRAMRAHPDVELQRHASR